MKRIILLTVILFAIYMMGFKSVANAGEQKGGETDCCICSIDQAKKTFKIVPWNRDRKSWESQEAIEQFSYNDETKVKGQNGKNEDTFTLAEFKSGRTVTSKKGSHLAT